MGLLRGEISFEKMKWKIEDIWNENIIGKRNENFDILISIIYSILFYILYYMGVSCMRLTPDIDYMRALDVREGLIISLFLFLQEFTRIKWSKNRDERWGKIFLEEWRKGSVFIFF